MDNELAWSESIGSVLNNIHQKQLSATVLSYFRILILIRLHSLRNMDIQVLQEAYATDFSTKQKKILIEHPYNTVQHWYVLNSWTFSGGHADSLP